MEDNFNQNDFEEFLQEQVKNHRMYPADTVWRDINKSLHGDKKWPALTIAAFTLLSATIAICIHFTPKPDIFASNNATTSTFQNAQSNNVLNHLPSSTSLFKEKSTFPIVATQLPEPGATSSVITDENNTAALAGRNKKSVNLGKIDAKATGGPLAYTVVKKTVVPEIIRSDLAIQTQPKSKDVESNPIITLKGNEIVTFKENNPSEEKEAIGGDEVSNPADNFLKDHKDDISLYTKPKIKTLKNKFAFQLYIAPSMSYRKLLEDRSMLKEGTNAGPVGLNYITDVNNVVRHKPGNGIEAGVSVMYDLTDKFRVKSGVQFNVRQYSIEAYRSSTELASIALIGANGIDTINTIAVYRTNNGYYSAELVNRYYQVAIPVGVEWEIIGNKNIQLNIAGSIQPTYLINRNAYLISTNFKNYTENPEMVRSFNINSNLETFLSFKFGDFKWQLGPQIRYQPYSTFIRQYPIKEHLLDYGIKFGLSKTIN